jgi:hypothetical protein
MMNLPKIALDLKQLAKSYGWSHSETRLASTGSIYVELVRDGREWVVIRVADHKQVYNRWITTYSISPGNLHFEDVSEILDRPFGQVGDVLL